MVRLCQTKSPTMQSKAGLMVVLSPLAVIGVPACTAFPTLIIHHRFVNILGGLGADGPQSK